MRTWLVGLLAGVLGGILTVSFGIGLLPLGPAVLVVGGFAPPRPVGLAGMLVGLGGIWLVLFGRIQLECIRQPTVGPVIVAPGGFSECVSADLTPWLVLAAAIALAGVGLTASLVARRPRRP